MSSTRLAKAKRNARRTGQPPQLEHDWSEKPARWGMPNPKKRQERMQHRGNHS